MADSYLSPADARPAPGRLSSAPVIPAYGAVLSVLGAGGRVVHGLRHSAEMGDVRTVQELLGHGDVSTTMICCIGLDSASGAQRISSSAHQHRRRGNAGI